MSGRIQNFGCSSPEVALGHERGKIGIQTDYCHCFNIPVKSLLNSDNFNLKTLLLDNRLLGVRDARNLDVGFLLIIPGV